MTTPLRPQFFCSRPNGTLTPLIALDELPSHISIRGIPRALSPGDTLGMTSLGTVIPRAQFYIVDGLQPGPVDNSTIGLANAVRDTDAQTAVFSIGADDAMIFNPRLALQAVNQQQPSQNWIAPTSAVAGSANQVAATGSSRSNGKQDRRDRSSSRERRKVYCSFWIRTGECDYTQQGCKFKHEMPMDSPTLAKCGLRDIPQWYREKYGVPSLHSRGNGQSRPQLGSGQPWRQNTRSQTQSTPTKSIPYLNRMGITAANTEISQDQSMSFNGESINRNFLGQQPNATAKKLDLLSFDPLPDYPTLNPVRDDSSDDTVSPTADKQSSPVRGADFDRTQNPDWMFKFGPLLHGSEAYPDSPVKNVQNKGRPKRAQRSRRLYDPRPDSSRPTKGCIPADDSLTPLKTKFDNGTNRFSETSSNATRTPSDLTASTPSSQAIHRAALFQNNP
ncbi:hypothetical protein VTN77DRAFT_3951 [Rasamsonia byssochlamydoides]|uniref:uncharacterized protein n=1 Tax=Rasamsonia byssochlamydoides TaxID=89139 RepID=UPI003744A062